MFCPMKHRRHQHCYNLLKTDNSFYRCSTKPVYNNLFFHHSYLYLHLCFGHLYLQRTVKKYGFEVEGVPEESEYLEVKYSVSSSLNLFLYD
jgi:hypothetical protein